MATPTNRETLIDWCLGQLGHPVTEINVDEEQAIDAVEQALQYYRDFHYDAVERWYFAHQVTDTDITNKYFPVDPLVAGITRIFPLGTTNASVNMFDLRYQMRLHELFDFTSVSYTSYVITMQHLRTLDLLFTGEAPIRFNRHSDRLYVDWNWGHDVQAGEYIIMEGFIVLDPVVFTKVWNDRMLKKLATAYIKKQWGTNMKKFSGMKLPGGVTMNGKEIFDEAVAEIAELEGLIRSTYEEPPQFIIA